MIELEFRNVDFWGGRKSGDKKEEKTEIYPSKHILRSKGENQQQTQLTYDTE
jgi:hypothetical protein